MLGPRNTYLNFMFDMRLGNYFGPLCKDQQAQIFVHLETVLFCFADDDWYLWSVLVFLKMVCSGMCQRGEVWAGVGGVHKILLITCETALQFVVINLFFYGSCDLRGNLKYVKAAE